MDRFSLYRRRLRDIAVVLCAAGLIASTLGQAARADDQPSVTFENLKADAWAFAFFPDVLQSKVAHLIPEGWTPIACRLRGQNWPLVPGTAQFLLVGKRDHVGGVRGLPETITHWTLGLCADPPSEDMLFPGQIHRGIGVKTWIDSEEGRRFESQFGLRPETSSIKILGDVTTRDWGIEVRSADGVLEFAADFKIASEKQCLMVGESARMYDVSPTTGEVGAYDVFVPPGNLEACYGSTTTVRADAGTMVAEVLGTSAVPAIAGVERSDSHMIRYLRLRNPSGR